MTVTPGWYMALAAVLFVIGASGILLRRNALVMFMSVELMLQAGMSPMQIIVAATRNAALVSNRLGDLGTVEVGKIADLIAVRGDPLQDIHALADVRLVLHSGVVIRNDGFD